jgi:hypothetical protein
MKVNLAVPLLMTDTVTSCRYHHARGTLTVKPIEGEERVREGRGGHYI